MIFLTKCKLNDLCYMTFLYHDKNE